MQIKYSYLYKNQSLKDKEYSFSLLEKWLTKKEIIKYLILDKYYQLSKKWTKTTEIKCLKSY